MNLEKYYSKIIHVLKIEKNNDIIISKNDFSNEDITLFDDKIIIRKGNKSYSGYGESFVDFVLIFITKEKLKLLALSILNSIFNSNDKKIKIKLTNPYSDIHYIYLEPFTNNNQNCSIYCQPVQYNHAPFEISEFDQKYKFADSFENKISTCLRQEKEIIDNYEDFKSRDIFQGFGSIHGTGKLVDLLFDLSLYDNKVTEVTFENEIGFGQLTPGSCEFRIILYNENCSYNPMAKYDLFFK